MDRLMVGAVAYGGHVVPIWEGIREHFRGTDVEMDFVLFSNYEAQVEALLGERIDIAWNTNLAYVRAQLVTDNACSVLAMRDTDVGFSTVLVGRTGELSGVHELRGKRLALGSADSAQAAILPVYFLQRDEGLVPDDDYSVVRFNSDVGKHGDTGRSEIDAMQAVLDGSADLASMG
ncbi:MAG: PhnD/SsuA/transferrin family substrate-binding protein, partial [Dehalococcoidia bacterium]